MQTYICIYIYVCIYLHGVFHGEKACTDTFLIIMVNRLQANRKNMYQWIYSVIPQL